MILETEIQQEKDWNSGAAWASNEEANQSTPE